ncbi:Putative disease resistance RPP13-like protein [Arachis hypogaea]|nr:Putative disease resistance RPP13-like protein [Arachis hypogaea]
MAEALVVGALVSGFANVVLDRLISSEFVNLVVGKKLNRKLVERLKTAILAAKALAADAEQKQFGNELVREWLDNLKDALYTADDLLDRVFIKAQIRSKVRTRLPHFLDLSGRKMVTKIEEVVERIVDLEKRKDTLGLKEIPTGSSSSWRPPSTSLVKGNVYGRDGDQQALIKMLHDNNDHHLSVISIVGMGGVGKTTLAQWLYNNEDLMKGFDLKAWISLIYFNKIKEKLSEKKFFIVLDDVWSEDVDKWNSFVTSFQHGRKGSTILLTTRKENVGPIAQNYNAYFLEGLSDDYCWSIFADNASFLESNWSSELEGIGRKIVKKCDGLPLAAETLGRLLRSKHDVKEWNKILLSDIWEFPMTDSKVVPALLISYYHLPAHLKRCFVYCSLYPKDHQYDKDELILLWMAEDLLRPPKRRETLEEVGCECFDDLASRLFFKQVEGNDEKYFVMHDLMHDLATFLAGEFYCRLSEELDEKEEMRILTRKLIQLRYLDLSRTAVKILPESLCKLYNLQTLKLEDCSELTMLPDGMCNLVNLRHLDIRSTPLKEMPKGIGKLRQLHILSNFVVGKHEDNGIQELGGLLNLHGSLEIQKLENVVDANQARSARIIDKKHIEFLLLEWSSIDDMASDTQTERDILHSLQPHTGLKKLTVDGYKGKMFPSWIGHSGYQNMIHVSLLDCKNCCILPSLGQLPSLKSLCIEGFDKLRSIGDEFYRTEGDHHSLPIAPFPSLENLEVDNMACWEEWQLPDSEAFPRLKRLQIRNCPMLKGDMLNHVLMRIVSSSLDVSKVHKVKIVEDHEGWRIDMSLDGDTLSIKGCESVTEYAIKAIISINHLTSLQEIEISGCSSAVSFPCNCLPKSLQKLKIYSCSKLELFPQQQQQKYDLVELRIDHSCDSLTSLWLDAFPILKNLEISWCLNLESVSMSEPSHAALQRLTIFGCDKLMSFPGEGQATPNLTHLSMIYCNKLEALPRDLNTLLPNLQSLDIRCCEEICRLPEGGFPPNLKELRIGRQWRDLSWMSNLDALTHLTIHGGGSESITSFPEVGSLPHLPSLTNLCLAGFHHTKTLECSELLRFTSLQELNIEYCPNLENMEGEKLPPSLRLLYIYQCPLLEQFLQKDQRPWTKIYNNPTVYNSISLRAIRGNAQAIRAAHLFAAAGTNQGPHAP